MKIATVCVAHGEYHGDCKSSTNIGSGGTLYCLPHLIYAKCKVQAILITIEIFLMKYDLWLILLINYCI